MFLAKELLAEIHAKGYFAALVYTAIYLSLIIIENLSNLLHYIQVY